MKGNISHHSRQLSQHNSCLYIVKLIIGEVTKEFGGKVSSRIMNWFSAN